ncbi:anthranilate phosphoribosyltransferase [Pacificimonas sp. WHA3]|uniref:Anthranilate phosphoribosyltransferase n=1 Tax=Pacificimonas pallii TaxID=2827236 RepID=A0ABS6SDU5_9SPHN|nr:anthranilate phosphoribosyltransferase [Pacificimonas pallii]MBV7256525.1 anthranilate phosphoribosyltransferase [Pacificimonas pallii]
MKLPDPKHPLRDPEAAFSAILAGRIEDADIARFLVGLAERGETVSEIVAAAGVLRAHMVRVDAPAHAIDVCGTGGDGMHTRNISTAVAILVAACGVPVAKHGNRAASSQSGAADVLSCLGLSLDLAPDRLEASISEVGIGFLFAARHHPVMARVAPVRKALGRRTIFNLLGPLSNPAGVTRQLVGVFSPEWTRPLAKALLGLGAERAMVVHGHDGLDELTVTGTSVAGRLDHGRIDDVTVSPADAGLSRHDMQALRGGTPQENAAALLRLLDGEIGAYRDITVLNAAAALVVAGISDNLADAAAVAVAALDDGAAKDKFEQWRAFR